MNTSRRKPSSPAPKAACSHGSRCRSTSTPAALNVAFVPGDGFFPNGGNFHCLRMNYSNMPDDRIVEGVKRLAEVMKKYIK